MTRMTRYAVLGAVLVLTAAGTAAAVDRVYKPHSQVNDPALVLQLRQQMAQLEQGFSDIEDNYKPDGADFAKIIEALDRMDAARLTLGKIATGKSWKAPLKGLTAQIGNVREAASKQDAAILRKQIDGLYDACFRCHAVNAPQYR